MLLPFIILWEIWKARNEGKFKGAQFKAQRIVNKIIHNIWTITLAWGWKRKHWIGDLSVSRMWGIRIPPNRVHVTIGKWINPSP